MENKEMFQIHIPENIKSYPMEYEVSAAILLAHFLETDITFIKRTHAKTADFLIKNQIWELKSPIGDSKRTIQNNLRKADNQSSNIILDLRRCKMNSVQAMNRIRFELGRANKIRHLIVIKKKEEIIVLK